jgi:N-acetylglucosaminyl-diphospho-decaprenol L-rhamnosyltransferase
MRITVIVPTFNAAAHIHACLESVRRCLPDAEVLVVDNGSTDATCKVVSEDFPPVELIAGHGNVGFGRACNLGAGRASGEYLLFLNPDAEIVSVDEAALAAFTAERPLGMVGVMLSDGGQSPQPTVIRRQRAHWLGELIVAHLLRKLSPYAPHRHHVEQAKGRGIFVVDGAVFLVSTSEFRLLDGFDERFFMYSEDADLSRRYRQMGYPLRTTSALLARHERGTSAPTPQLLALSFLGWLEYTSKWRGRQSAVRAAVLARVAYSAVLSALRTLAAITGSERAVTKAEQMVTMLFYIATEGLPEGSAGMRPRYPSAGPIAVRVFHSFAPTGADRKTSG